MARIEISDPAALRTGLSPLRTSTDSILNFLFKDMTNRFETRRMNNSGTRIARAGEFSVRDRRFGFYFYFSISRGALSAGSDG